MLHDERTPRTTTARPVHADRPDGFLLGHLAEETRRRARTAAHRRPPRPARGADLLDALRAAVDELGPMLLAASHDLSAHPEVSFEEHRSAAALADIVEARGIEVVREAHGLATGLRAEVGDPDGPRSRSSRSTTLCPGIGHGAATT